MFEYSGFKNVYLLEGGFKVWRMGNPVERRVVHEPITDFTVKPDPSILSSAESITSSDSRRALILDVRSEGEYQGAEKRDCCERYGRIPGPFGLNGPVSFKTRNAFSTVRISRPPWKMRTWTRVRKSSPIAIGSQGRVSLLRAEVPRLQAGQVLYWVLA